ncbi:hypothetical protein OG455_21935 [Kitasatospora sp. NBC_01287]|uniref:hypothetical protein n=1 Tax=Kitasatospora sp. NBC_01287 TaxID=2903573 RepID=UPI0022566C39|nr:hypothetical protein [Kitasatospora sp. NBC_01287]MCX4748140.1 hypothetical protein [Kitasatospora sp. NBC_01287]
MPRPLLLLPALVVVLLLACWLAHGALSRWRGERAARTYELTADLRPVVLRLLGAVCCGMCATGLAVAAVLGGHRGLVGGVRPVRAEAVVADAVRAAPVLAPPAQPAPSAAAAPPVPLPGAAVGGSSGRAAVRFETVSHPAEGELLQAAVPGADGRPRDVRVWLPPHYADDPVARFPVLVLHAAGPGRTADAELPDVFDGLASAIKLGRAHPFIAVAPAAPSGTEHPCDLVAAAPQALGDDAALRAAVAGAFRTLPPGPQGWATLGVDGGAPCAVAAGLTRPDLYGAAAAVSGRYDAAALAQAAADAPSGPAPRLLLAAAKSDTDGLAAAHKVADALRAGKGQAARAVVKISDVVQDYTPERARLRLVRAAAQYLMDALAHPAG